MGLNDFAINLVAYASLPTSVSISSPLAPIPRKFSSLVEVVFIFEYFCGIPIDSSEKLN